MKITIQVDGEEYYSAGRPTMKHIRIGGKLLKMQEDIADKPQKMQEYLDEVYGYIKDTFPKMQDEVIDSMPTDKFTELIGDITKWANGGQASTDKQNQKKN